MLSVNGGGVGFAAGLSASASADGDGDGDGFSGHRAGAGAGVGSGHNHAHAQLPHSESRGVRSGFVSVRPDGEALRCIMELVEKGTVRGRVKRVVELWDGGQALGGGSSGSSGSGESESETGTGMVVLRVN